MKPPSEMGKARLCAIAAGACFVVLGILSGGADPARPAVPPLVAPTPVAAPCESVVHCVCGPPGDHPNDQGCQVVVEYAATTVVPSTSLNIGFFASSPERFAALNESVYACLGLVGNVRPRLWWDWKQLELRTHHAEYGSCAQMATPSSTTTSSSSMRDTFEEELLWVSWWPMDAYYHFVFQSGVYQAYLFQILWPAVLRRPLPPVRINLMWLSNYTRRRLRAAQWELWNVMVPSPRGFEVLRPATYCSRYVTFGVYWASPMTYRPDYTLFPGIKRSVGVFAMNVQRRLLAKYGDVERPALDDRVLMSNRPARGFYDNQNRSRGIEPELAASIEQTIKTAIPTVMSFDRFNGSDSLQAQFHQVRRHRIAYADEGSFFVSTIFAPPQSTWILVYNHSRAPTEWKHCNFHATVASALPFMRLVIFIVERGLPVPPQDELLRILQSPWRQGVYYVGADENGNRLPETTQAPATAPPEPLRSSAPLRPQLPPSGAVLAASTKVHYTNLTAAQNLYRHQP